MHTKIVIDAGATTMKWAIIHPDGSVIKRESAGWNASVAVPFPDLSPELLTTLHNCNSLYYYGAGVSSQEKRDLLKNTLHNFNPLIQIEVYSDLVAAARALFTSQPGPKYGIVCILGTGSNVAYYEDDKLHYRTPSLGYLLSDEGSGNKIGSAVIKSYFYNTMPSEVSTLFASSYDIHKEEFLTQIYHKPQANKFLASYAAFLSTIDHPWKDALLMTQFRELIEAKILPHKNFLSVPIGFVGSIANVFSKQLEESCKKYDIHNIQIIANPIDRLIDYHKRRT